MTTAKIALAAVTFAIDKPYTYRVPEDMAETLRPGMRVLVPFGTGNRRSEGIVLSVSKSERREKLKTVFSVLDETPILDHFGIQLALWMRDRYFCTVYTAVQTMLPAGLLFSLKDLYRVVPGVTQQAALEAASRSPLENRILELIFASGGSMERETFQEAFGAGNPKPALNRLVREGILTLETGVKRKLRDKTERIATLRIPSEEAMAAVEKRKTSAPMRYAVTELLCKLGSASVKELCYFTGASLQTIRSLEKSGILSLEEQAVFRHPAPLPWAPTPPAVLNQEQREALTGLEALLQTKKPEAALLYGVTGSGKTQVYMALMETVLASGRTAMVLVPEIALTPGLLQLFLSRFGSQVAVLHSSLPAGERYDEWKRVRDGQAKVVIGTRSAVFAPLPELGLIILDEEQEGSYKSESVLRYHTRDVAKFRCNQHHALLLLGSATPSVETMYAAWQGIYHLFRLRSRYNQNSLPEVFIADMKEELRAGNGTGLGSLLRRELERNFDAGEQSILFLNRRGTSRMVSCGECGEVPVCPRCSAYLTYHAANGRLMCHYCGHSEKLPEACPVCGGRLQLIGIGTQKIEEELHLLYPEIEVLRMDTDTVTAARSHEVLLDRFQRKKIPILLGTQMVAKGLDFENVTLVGVIAADLSLYVDSFRASERTFSLLTQVVGRAGRGTRPGRAVIQTWTPEHEVIRLSAKQDYDSFYQQELAVRQLRRFPPVSDLFQINVSGGEEERVLQVCSNLKQTLENWCAPLRQIIPMEIYGPAPARVVKVNNRYRYHLILNCRNTKEVRGILAMLLRTAQEDRRNRGLSLSADLNPMD